jgi:uncharacterized membrane protein YuzA (DUF378 family)
MEYLKRLEPLALVLVIVGALNWGMVGLFDENVIANVFDDATVLDVIYIVVGVAALVLVPRLLEGLHLTGRPARPHGA